MNFAWRDYGNRVGAWRSMERFDRIELKTTALLNSAVIEQCPGLVEACQDRGDEIAPSLSRSSANTGAAAFGRAAIINR